MEVLSALGTSSRKVVDVVEGLETVCKLLGNILTSPREPKYRRVRTSNARISELVGKEEFALLQAAGFEYSPDADGDDHYVLPEGAEESFSQSLATIQGLFDATKVALDVLRQKIDEAPPVFSAAEEVNPNVPPIMAALKAGSKAAESSKSNKRPRSDLQCNNQEVASALECGVLDHVQLRAVESAENEKRLRRTSDEAAVRSSCDWKDVFGRLGGLYLCDNGPLETWLGESEDNRILAFRLLHLQQDAVRWYGSGARSHCERWRDYVTTLCSKEDDGSLDKPLSFTLVLQDELGSLQDAIFDMPDTPGAAPSLFRTDSAACDNSAAMAEAQVDAECTIVETPTPARERDLVAVESLE